MITVDGGDGNDTLTVDFSGGNPIPSGGLTFNGGGQTTVPPGDDLLVTGGSFGSVAYNATGSGAGNLVFDGSSTISFTGLEPVTVASASGTTTVSINDGLSHAAVFTAGPGAGNNTVTIDGGLESLTFANPSAELIVQADAGSDTFTFTSLDSGFRAALTVDGSTGPSDTVNLNTSLTLGSATSTGNVDIDVENINLNASSIATDQGVNAGAVTLNGTIWLGANVVIDADAATTDGNVTFNGSVNADNAATQNRTLTVTAGSGTVQFTSTLGATQALADFDATGALIRLGGNMTVNDGAGGQTVTFAAPVQLDASVTLNTDGVNDNHVAFTSTVNGAQSLGLQAGSGNIDVQGAIGDTAALAQVTISSANNVNFGGTIRTQIAGHVTQTAGTGTTTLNGTSGIGIGGSLSITTNAITLNTATVVTHSAVTLNAQNAITVNAGIDASSSFLTIAANQDGADNQGFTQASGTTIRTSEVWTTTVSITVNTGGGGGGGAAIGTIQTAGGGRVVIQANAGVITDNNGASMNITAGQAELSAANGIGSGDALETTITNLAYNNTASGNVAITNTGALVVNSVGAIVTSSNVGTTILVASSPITFAVNSSQAVITATATDSAGGGVDNITVNSGVTVTASSGDVTFNAGDDVSIPAGAIVQAAFGNILLNVDGAAGTDSDVGTGATVTVAGTLTAVSTTILGGADSDIFNVLPQAGTPISVDGQAPVLPTLPGDTLNMELSGIAAGNTVLLLGAAGSGTYSFLAPETEQPVSFASIETNNTSVGQYHLVLDMVAAGFQNGSADTVDAQLNGANLELRVNGGLFFAGAAADIQSLTVLGSSDGDTFTVTETASGLPYFAAAAPAGVGGAPTSNGSHLNAPADSLLTAMFGGSWDASDVTIHFDGRGGVNAMGVTWITAHQAAYWSDTLDTAKSGNIGSISALSPTSPDLLLSFANVSPLGLLTGGGGSLLLDATGTPTTQLTMRDSGGAGVTQVTGDGGFETTTFGGFGDVYVLGGGGPQTITLESADGDAFASGQALANIVLDGDNVPSISPPYALPVGTDTSSDTLTVESVPGTVAVRLLGWCGE